MKYLPLLILPALLLTASCEQTVQAGAGLSAKEREYLAGLARTKCMNDTQDDLDDFKADSSSNMLDMERDQSWKYKDSSSTQDYSISVWKVSPPNIYFRLNIVEDGETKNKFIKINTTTNNDMLTLLQTKKCDKALTLTLSASAATATVEDAKIPGDEADTKTQLKTVYNFKSAFPAYFGSLDRVKTKKTYNSKDVVTKTDTFTFSITSISNPSDQNDLHTAYSNRFYCMVKFTSTNTYDFPFNLKCTDTANDEAGVDVNIDGTKDFVPTELAI